MIEVAMESQSDDASRPLCFGLVLFVTTTLLRKQFVVNADESV